LIANEKRATCADAIKKPKENVRYFCFKGATPNLDHKIFGLVTNEKNPSANFQKLKLVITVYG